MNIADHAAAAVRAVGLRKVFGPTVAVDDVSFEIQPGTVHALLGENGAGKSTVVKLLSGLIEPSGGHIEVDGQPVRLRSPRAAHALGIQTAFQEMTLVADLPVLDNMLMPYAPRGLLGMVRRRAAAERVAQHLHELDFDVDLYAEAGTLDLAVRQKIEIARAVLRAPRILLLDEPTSTLAGRDVDWLGSLIARLKAQGTTVVFISHRMREVRAFCDRLTILRNGRHISTGPAGELDDDAVIERIVGRSVSRVFPPRPADAPAFGPEVLGARGLDAGKVRGVDFSLRRGEILGVAGLQGMGQLDLFHACFGMLPPRQGQIQVDGRTVALGSPADAIRPNIGIGMVPEDRKTEGLFLKLDGRANATLPVVQRYTRGGVISAAAENAAVERAFARVQVDRRAAWTPAGAFSGGNQQKIAIAKWLLAQSRILLLFDPTRGIDVGTKHELYVLMRQYVAEGGAILFHSTEIPEIVHLCDRALVLYGGQVRGELAGPALTEQGIMRIALGGDAQRRAA
ncbi:sugar ABC transporter ATP-binding protein [Bordetella sp. BOR01]|nr:sugar ABC transporter ATP-binding protein [Bordetella sp. BOR01]